VGGSWDVGGLRVEGCIWWDGMCMRGVMWVCVDMGRGRYVGRKSDVWILI